MSFGDVSERAKCKFLGVVTWHTIERLLDIKSIYEVTSLQIEKLRENWKAVEESLYINYAIPLRTGRQNLFSPTTGAMNGSTKVQSSQANSGLYAVRS
jgi:hypothetical protein